MVAAFEVGLVFVGGEEFCRVEVVVVGDQGEAAVGGGFVADDVGAGFPVQGEPGSGLLTERGLGPWGARVVGGVGLVDVLDDEDVEVAGSVVIGEGLLGGVDGGDAGLDPTFRAGEAVGEVFERGGGAVDLFGSAAGVAVSFRGGTNPDDAVAFAGPGRRLIGRVDVGRCGPTSRPGDPRWRCGWCRRWCCRTRPDARSGPPRRR